jgi:hypothetical protein
MNVASSHRARCQWEKNAMKYGMFSMPLRPPGGDVNGNYHKDIQTFIHADKLGYSEGWMGEHYTIPWEPIPAQPGPGQQCHTVFFGGEHRCFHIRMGRATRYQARMPGIGHISHLAQLLAHEDIKQRIRPVLTHGVFPSA